MRGMKLNLYDWLACLVPGVLVLFAVFELLALFNMQLRLSPVLSVPSAAQVIFLLIISYAMGHILHALANATIDRRVTPGSAAPGYFPSQFRRDFPEAVRKEMNAQVRWYFRLDDDEKNSIRSCYWLCHCLVTETYPESLVQVFVSIAGFSRGMAMAGFLVALLYSIVAVLTKAWQLDTYIAGVPLMGVLVIVAVFSGLLGWVFLNRVSRFRHYLARTVCAEFLNICEQRRTAPIEAQTGADD